MGPFHMVYHYTERSLVCKEQFAFKEFYDIIDPMLKQLRNKKTAKKVWILVTAAVVVTFIFWGSGAMRSKQDSMYAGRIFGRNYTALEYKDSFDAVSTAAILQFGDKLPEVQKYLNLESQAWERLMLLHEAKRRNVTASDKEVIDLIETYPFFQRNNRFDQRTYEEVTRYVFHVKPRIFEEQTRGNIMLSKLYDEVTKDAAVREEDMKDEYIRANEEISIYYIASLSAEFTKDVHPKDDELKDYFAKNSLNFKQPLSFNIEYAAFDSEDKAKSILPHLRRNADFNKVAQGVGASVKETGLFAQTDPVPGIGWSPDVLALLAKLQEGDFSPVLHIDKNYYLIRLKERKEPYIPEFEKIKEKVKERIIKEQSEGKAQGKMQECIKKIREEYAKNPKKVDMNKIAKQFGLKSDSTNLFKFGSYIEGIGASDNFWTVARQLKDDEFSAPITTTSGFYVIKPRMKVAIDEKKFEKEKAEFRKKLLAQKKQEFFTQFLEELKRKAQ